MTEPRESGSAGRRDELSAHHDASSYALAFWSAGLAHQIRNQETVLTQMRYLLDEATRAPEPSRDRECVRLGLEGLDAGLAILESFTRLAFPGQSSTPTTLAQCFGWVGTLIEPRLRRRESTFRVVPGPSPDLSIDPLAASRGLAEILEPLIGGLAPRRTLTLSGTPHPEGGVTASLYLSAEGADPASLLAEIAAITGAARWRAGDHWSLVIPADPSSPR